MVGHLSSYFDEIATCLGSKTTVRRPSVTGLGPIHFHAVYAEFERLNTPVWGVFWERKSDFEFRKPDSHPLDTAVVKNPRVTQTLSALCRITSSSQCSHKFAGSRSSWLFSEISSHHIRDPHPRIYGHRTRTPHFFTAKAFFKLMYRTCKCACRHYIYFLIWVPFHVIISGAVSTEPHMCAHCNCNCRLAGILSRDKSRFASRSYCR